MIDPATQSVAAPRRRRRIVARVVFWALALLASAWAYGALYFDGPLGHGAGNQALAAGWAVITLVLVWLARRPRRRILAWIACFLVVLVPWLSIPASNDRDWQPEWAKVAWAEIDGDVVTVHNVRNFDHARDGTVTERWETRTVRLSNLRAVDLFLDAFGGEYIAHPMLSYDFGPDGRLVVSIETRREVGESYSEFGGLYKMFELQYLVGDERDFVRVRSNVRDEPMFVYRLKRSGLDTRATFLLTLRMMNRLRDRPIFYNLVSHNCTTSYRAQTPTADQKLLDVRMLINGKLDEMLYDIGHLETGGLSFAELRGQAFFNDVAHEAHDDPLFSERIREGRAGFGG